MCKIGLTSNKLKTVAIISMIIDHIGYYFYYMMPDAMFLLFRIIGRISMPIFAFLIVQGYFKTGNIKGYIARLFKYAVITQILILVAYIINRKLVPAYEVNVYEILNILFSFSFSLCLVYIIDKKDKFLNSRIYDFIARIVIFGLIMAIYITCNIDYNFIIPIMIISMYFNEKNNKKNTKMDRYIYNFVLTLIIFITSSLQQYIGAFSMLSVIFIVMYNGELGKKSNNLKKLFYYIFPIQHATLYLLALVIYMLA